MADNQRTLLRSGMFARTYLLNIAECWNIHAAACRTVVPERSNMQQRGVDHVRLLIPRGNRVGWYLICTQKQLPGRPLHGNIIRVIRNSRSMNPKQSQILN